MLVPEQSNGIFYCSSLLSSFFWDNSVHILLQWSIKMTLFCEKKCNSKHDQSGVTGKRCLLVWPTKQLHFYFNHHTLPFGLSCCCCCCSCSCWSVSSIWARVTFPPCAASFWDLPFSLAFSSSRSRWFSFFLSRSSSLFFSLSSCTGGK